MTTLSVVMITKNQEWNIARLIESVLAETATLDTKEIILVDSASTDETVERASRYPIRIVRLHTDQRLTAAAGRYTGYRYTQGNFVLFLDGDMELYPGWIDKALPIIQNNPDIGVIVGHRIDLPKDAGEQDKPPLSQADSDSVTEIDHGGGAALYRRSVMEQVGTFNPYIYSDEEPELCIRIRHAGYRACRLEHTIVYHYTDPPEETSTLLLRRGRNLYIGYGQNIRFHLGTDILWPYIRERGFGCLPGLVLVTGLMVVAHALVTHKWVYVQRLFVLTLAAVLGDAYRRGNVQETFYSIIQRGIMLEGTIRGFLLPPMNPDQYPCHVDVVQWVP
ncbi:MAG: glycosyltransferase [Chloroflexaceae bacterium]|nr:glycosyltransferase [Chloroflexaceae bacterium]